MKIEVKIAVAIDEAGNWAACGYAKAEDDLDMATAMQSVDPQEGDLAQFYVVAKIEVPKPKIVIGKVTPQAEGV